MPKSQEQEINPDRPPEYDGPTVWVQVPEHLVKALEVKREAVGSELTVSDMIAAAIEVAHIKGANNEWWAERIKQAEGRIIEYRRWLERVGYYSGRVDYRALRRQRRRERNAKKIAKQLRENQ